MGKSTKLVGRPSDVWGSADVWLEAERIRRLFVTDSQVLTARALAKLHERTGQNRVPLPEIWLIDTSGERIDGTAALEFDSRIWNFEEFKHRHRQVLLQRAKSLKEENYPTPWFSRLKLADLPTRVRRASPVGFVEVAGQELPASVFRELQSDFFLSKRMFEIETASHDYKQRNFEEPFLRPWSYTLLCRLRFALTSALSDFQALVRVKAAQMAALERRMYLSGPPLEKLMDSCRKSNERIEQIRSIGDPGIAMLSYLPLKSGLDVLDLRQIRTGWRGGLEFAEVKVASQTYDPLLSIASKRTYALDAQGEMMAPQRLHSKLMAFEKDTHVPMLDFEWPRRAGVSVTKLNGERPT